MRRRMWAVIALAIAVMTSWASPAEAATGPATLQRLAAAQTQLLFRYYNGPPQVAAPSTCNQGQAGHDGDTRGQYRTEDGGGRGRVFLLPTLSFGNGDETFWCKMEATAVLVDLGGSVATEDKRPDTSFYLLKDGEKLTFTRHNLPRICDDALRFFPTSAPATVDNRVLNGTPVSTTTFMVKVHPGTLAHPNVPYYQDSIDLGHPGSLAACYVGQKAIVPLKAGRHIIKVMLTGADGVTPTRFTYHIEVACR